MGEGIGDAERYRDHERVCLKPHPTIFQRFMLYC
jgi:hypothetical protein